MALRDDDPIAWLIACEEIRQLASRYAVHLDARDLDALVQLFDPQIRGGRDALRESFATQLRSLGRSILSTSNHVIDVLDADTATGIVSCRGEIEPLDAPGTWVVQQIQYHDKYVRRDGRWYFVGRRHLSGTAPTCWSDPSASPTPTGPRTTRVRASCPSASSPGNAGPPGEA